MRPYSEKRGKREKKHRFAQVSIEYMAILGVTTLVLIALLGISNYYSKNVGDAVNTNQLDAIAKDIVDKSESVYYYGQPSKTTLKVFIPENIRSINISSNEINFKMNTQSGISDMFYHSNVPLNGTISSLYGFHYITIEAREGYVWINGS